MYGNVIFFMVYLSLSIAEETNGTYVLRTRRITRQSGSEEKRTAENNNACILPPYPKNGRYLVIGVRDAVPGDVFQNVSLIQYEVDEKNDTFPMKSLSCSIGKWSENTFQYESKELFFDPDWCPILCPPSVFSNVTDPASVNSTKTYRRAMANATANSVCRLPPPGAGRRYYHHDLPDLRIGEEFELISSLYQYRFDGNSGLYVVNRLSCIRGTWYIQLFHAAMTLNFKRRPLCSMGCASPVAEKSSEVSPVMPIKDPIRPYLPWSSTLDGKTNSVDLTAAYCELPAYPKLGGYFVIDNPTAGPGDVFEKVSLVQYIDYDMNNQTAAKLLSCSSGIWTESIFQYQSEKLYFNSSWCPTICSSYKTKNSTDATSGKSVEANGTVEQNTTRSKLCVIPPYPVNGGHYLADDGKQDAKPGDTFENFNDFYQYMLYDSNGIYEVKDFACVGGTWYTKILTMASNSWIYFAKKNWCRLLCTSPKAVLKPQKPGQVLNSPHLPWRTVLDKKSSNIEQPRRELCEMPQYPKNGSYVVIDRPDARPGDVFENASLVRYVNLNKSHIDIQVLSCSFGQWSRTIFQYQSRKLYFDTAWCPFLCLPTEDGDGNATVTSKRTDDSNEKKSNSEKPCELPPYPDGGSYIVHGKPGAGPGDKFEQFAITRYVPDDSHRFYKIEEIWCVTGTWYRTLFQIKDETLFFKKETFCPLFCPIFRNTST